MARVGSRDALEAFESLKEEHKKITAKNIISEEEKALEERITTNRATEAKMWQRIHERLDRDQGFEAYHDFFAIVMSMVNNAEALGEAITATMSTLFPNAYPTTLKDLFVHTIPGLVMKVVGAPLFPVAKLIEVAKERAAYGSDVAKTLYGQVDLKLNDDGTLQADFSIQGQKVEHVEFLETYRTLVLAYLQSKGYDIDTRPGSPSKVIYTANHPLVISGLPGGPQAGDPISSQDFKKDVQKDDALEFRNFMKKVATNQPSLRYKLGP